MSSHANRLAKLQSAWANDRPESGSGALPEGKYQFIIKRAVLEESKASFNKGNLQVSLTLVVHTGPLKGRKHIYRQDLEAKANPDKGWPSGMSRFKGVLETLQIDMPKTLDEKGINATLKNLIDVVLEGACVINAKGYANVYINGLVNAPAESEDEEEETEEEDDEEEAESEDEDESDDDEDDEEEEEEKPTPPKSKSKPADSKEKSKPEKKKATDDDWDDEFNEDD